MGDIPSMSRITLIRGFPKILPAPWTHGDGHRLVANQDPNTNHIITIQADIKIAVNPNSSTD